MDLLPAWLSRPLPARDLLRSAVVFSPHPDDETLGCGGTIIRKRALGAEVHIVFMTDGRHSHRGFMEAQRLAERRAREAAAAARVMGCLPQALRFLAFEDGSLAAREAEALPQVLEILEGARPEQIFVPCARDGQPDHEATWRIVLQAVRQRGEDCSVFEYPVWLWNARRRHLRLIAEFGTGVSVTEVLDRKRAALACYETQMSRLAPRWPVLSDVSGGRWLARLFGPAEVFKRLGTAEWAR